MTLQGLGFNGIGELRRPRPSRPVPVNSRAIVFFNLGCHGLTVFGMAVRLGQSHGHGEEAKTVPPASQFEKGDGPGVNSMLLANLGR